MSAVPAPDAGPDAGAVWHYGDPLGEQRAAMDEAVVVDRSHRAVLTLTGGDRKSWLHNISTQHVSELPDGTVTQNLSLDGQGRVEDHWIQTELGDVTYPRHRTVARRAAAGAICARWCSGPTSRSSRPIWPCCHCSAPDWPTRRCSMPSALVRYRLKTRRYRCRTAVSCAGSARRTFELDLVVPRADAADWLNRLTAAGVRPAGVWAYEAHRVAALRPRLGVDTDERTIPHEVGWIGSAVHLDKGCYRGQETVARVHNLGKPPRMLVLLHLDGAADRPSTGDPVLAGGRAVGRLGTVVDHVDLGPIALALLKRGLPADTALTTGGEVEVAAAIDADSHACRRRDAGRAGWPSSGCAVARAETVRWRRACQRSAAGHGKVLAGQ